MQFSPTALVVMILFFAGLGIALTTGAGSPRMHVAEATVTVLIAIGLAGFALRGPRAR